LLFPRPHTGNSTYQRLVALKNPLALSEVNREALV
jgi:hypothetical protein